MPARANSSRDPISKKPFTKKNWQSAQGVGPEFKPQHCKNKTNSTYCIVPSGWHFGSDKIVERIRTVVCITWKGEKKDELNREF
jgi:hypothetical protein